MNNRPLHYPTKIKRPLSKDRTWYKIPHFPGYEISIPHMEVKDMRREDIPGGTLVPEGIAKAPKNRSGERFVRIIGDDGVLYKSFVSDLFDLVVKDINKDIGSKFGNDDGKLPFCFKPVGSNNYKNKLKEVREYWRDKEYYATTQR